MFPWIPGVPPRAKRGFTLVEMLISVAVVALLAALLVPGLKSAMERSLAAKCMGNLRQLGVAYLSYTADNGGNPPEPISFYTSSLEARSAWEGGTIKAVGLGKLQYGGYLEAPANVAVRGSVRSKLYHCPKRTAVNGWAYANDNWIDYSYLLTGRYQRAVFTKSSTAVATDVMGGTGMTLGEAWHDHKANVLYADGSLAQVPYAIYSTKQRSAEVFDRGYEPGSTTP